MTMADFFLFCVTSVNDLNLDEMERWLRPILNYDEGE